MNDFSELEKEFKTIESIDRELNEIEVYIERLKSNGIYTDWQKQDLQYNENRLKALNELKENM
jgi:hypothetical protein